MTYMGSNNDISTLAHELGHAYHSWSLRELSFAEKTYPSTLAETASIFAETLLRDTLVATQKSAQTKLDFLWGDISGAVSLLINIPARFEFETNFYEQRKLRTLSAQELSQLTEQAWNKWYGPVLSQPDSYFWAHKLHFAMTKTSFYNFPYTFGYLFGLSVYARKKSLGSKFSETYLSILRDTGRMTAEDLIQKHLGEDITQPQFWQKSIDVVVDKIRIFKTVVDQ